MGNRGWEVLIHEPSIAQQYSDVFAKDSDVSQGDLIDYTTGGMLPASTPEDCAILPSSVLSSAPSSVNETSAPLALEASAVTQIVSPDTSSSGLIALIDNAQTSVDLELMTFASNWGGVGKTSPLYNAVVKAGRRGVAVRVLLNDERAFIHSNSKSKVTGNQKTANLINEAASRENLNLTARIANVKAMGVDYIHNKGGLFDQDKTLISSINWNENSVEKNREAAVVLVSPTVHSHYQKLFERDWSVSAN